MCFKGGKEFGKGDIFGEVAKVGGNNNGMTSTDYTVYFETVPASHAELGLRIEADRMTSARFDPDEVASERSVIISEREGAENYPEFLLDEEMALTAYRTHPYRWGVIGWKADLRAITHEDLWNYYRAGYAPDNAVLVVAGDFETEGMLADIRRLFGGLEGKANVPQIRSVEPPQEGERRFTLRRPGTAAYLDLGFHVPDARHEDEPALRVLNSILSFTFPMSWMSPGGGGYKTSRIYRALVETELASGAHCRVFPREFDPGLAQFAATVRVGVEPVRVEEAMLGVIEEAIATPPTVEELEKAKTQLRAAMAYAGESAVDIANLLGAAEMVGSYESLAALPAKIEAVTAEDVLRVAQTYFTPNNRTTGWFLPTGTGGGGGGKMAAPEPMTFRHFCYTGLEIFRQARRETLENGMRVVACRSATTPAVSLTGAIRGGGILDSQPQAGRARFSTNCFERGTTHRTYREIAEALDRVGATFGASAGLESVNFGGNALSEHLDLLLDTARDLLREPVFPEDECEKVRTEILTSLRESDDSTRDMAMKRARQLLYPVEHPYHVWERGEAASVESLSRADLAAYHQEAVRPERTVLVLVGDFDPERAVDQVARRFADWRVAGEGVLPDLQAVPPTEMRTGEVLMPNKSQCDLIIATTGVPRTHEDYYRLDFATKILGQLGLMGRFGKTVRDQLGLAYYCFAAAMEGYGNPLLFAQAGVNPQNVQLAADTMVEQMRLMQQELVSSEEHEDLVTNQLGALAMLLETRSRIGSALLNAERWDLGPDYYERYPEIVRSVSREEIREAANKYFRPDAHVRVVAGPQWRA
jgi:zinc protease